MKTMVVGDLHGQHELALAALDTGYPVIFIGDYLDSFTRSPVEQIQTLKLVLEAIKAGAARGILANHETSYTKNQRCSGWNPSTQLGVDQIIVDTGHTDPETFQRKSDIDLLEDYIWHEGFLISHAGVSQRYLDLHKITLEEYLAAGDFEQVGRARGGRGIGGLRWCDWNYEFEPVPGVKQIVGHSRGNSVRERDGNYCIDCLEDTEPQVVLIEDGQLEVVNLFDIKPVGLSWSERTYIAKQ